MALCTDVFTDFTCRWFRHKVDSYDTHRHAGDKNSDAKKRVKVTKRGSLTAVDRLSDSMPSLALRTSNTSGQPLLTNISSNGHQKRSSHASFNV